MRRQVISLISVLCLTLSLVSCFGNDAKNPVMSKGMNVYGATELEFADDIAWINDIRADSGRVTARSSRTVDGVFTNVMISINPDTGKTTDQNITHELFARTYIPSIIPEPDGSLLMLLNRSENSRQFSSVARYKDGELAILCEDIAPLVAPGRDSYGFRGLCSDGDGNICIATEGTVTVFDRMMNKLCDVDVGSLDDSFRDFGVTNDGRVWVLYNDAEYRRELAFLNIAEKKLDAPLTLDGLTDEFRNAEILIGPDFNFYLRTDVGIYGYNVAEKGKAQEPPMLLCNFLSSDIIEEDLAEVVIIDSDRMIFSLVSDTSMTGYEILLMKHIPDEQVPMKTVITVGINREFNGLYALIVKFNRQSDKYRVVCTDYSNYNTPENPNAAEEKLKSDLLAGNAPDVIDVRGFDVGDALKSSGGLCDLYEFIDADPSLEREDIFASVLRACETGSKLYELPSQISLYSVVGKTALVGDSALDAEAYLKLAKKTYTDGKRLVLHSGKLTFENLLAASMGDFIDYKSGKVDFDNGKFRALLELAKLIEAHGDYELLTEEEKRDYESDPYAVLRDETVLLESVHITDVCEIYKPQTLFGGDDVTFVGYPNDGGESSQGCLLALERTYAISSTSACKEGAWEFVKYFMMSGELLTDRHVLSHGFPPLIDSYLKLANESKSTLSFHAYDGSTGRFTADNTYADRYKDRTDGILVEITDADIAYVQSLIDGASPMLMADGALMSIIGEEYSAYVSGAKSIDETVKLINDRVFTYISEKN